MLNTILRLLYHQGYTPDVHIQHEANTTTVQIFQKMPENAELRFCFRIGEEVGSVSYALLYPYEGRLTQTARMELYRTVRSSYEAFHTAEDGYYDGYIALCGKAIAAHVTPLYVERVVEESLAAIPHLKAISEASAQAQGNIPLW